MTHPTHGLDPNALEAAHRAYETFGQIGDLKARRLSDAAMSAVVKAALVALSQNPGTSKMSGEAVALAALRAVASDVLDVGSPSYLREPVLAQVLAALEPRASDRERTIEECAKAGWDACRKSIYAVCEDVQTQAADPNKVSLASTPDQKIHEKGFWLGYSDAAKSIARGFNAMEAPDDDNFAAAIRKLSEVSHE